MMKNNSQKVALVTESLWKMAGANRVLEVFGKIYPNADIYALFGNEKYLSEEIRNHNIYFSFLNEFPFIKSLYRYTFHLWPVAVESFDFSDYDLVISNSSSVAHGVIVPLDCKHLVYINSPMRYVWDMNYTYINTVRFGFLKRCIKEVLVNFIRVWDVTSAQRAGILVANSNFVAKRVRKYWGREVDYVINPPVSLYVGNIVKKRKNYYIAGAPFEPNKKGDFLLECASKIGFNLKLIGGGSMKKKLQRKYRKFKNIEFLDWITDEEKYTLIANSKGLIIPGIEDYGIFCAEAISCGTPVLAYGKGGSLEIVKDGQSGMFFTEWSLKSFKKVFKEFDKKDWKYKTISTLTNNVNTENSFKKRIKNILVE